MSLTNWIKSLIKREATLRDFEMMIIRNIFIKAQRSYNFYVKKEYFIDNMRGSNAIIMVLIGKYPDLWSVSLRRIYEYSRGLDVVLVNAGGFHRELAINVARDYGFSYFESYPNNYVAAQNYFLARYARSNLVIKIDDDVFVTKNTFRNMLQAFQKLKDNGVDIGFVAPVLNVNTVSYYYFLKTLNLLEEYKRLFEEPIVFREPTKQKIWRDPATAKYVWEKSLPLNQVAQLFEEKNRESIEVIPTRFSIGCILFERDFLLSFNGYLTPRPKFKHGANRDANSLYLTRLFIPYGDEDSINFYADTTLHGRFLILDSFAGHLSYYPQAEYMLDWFRKNRNKLLEDLNY
jgi:hypothetical protein